MVIQLHNLGIVKLEFVIFLYLTDLLGLFPKFIHELCPEIIRNLLYCKCECQTFSRRS